MPLRSPGEVESDRCCCKNVESGCRSAEHLNFVGKCILVVCTIVSTEAGTLKAHEIAVNSSGFVTSSLAVDVTDTIN